MGVEIERKFLVVGDAWRAPENATRMHQGYLTIEPERTVRVRVAGARAFVTIKGKSRGASRAEYEYEVPVQDADEMLAQLCLRPTLEKVRTRVPFGAHVWEVDEFLGESAGLVVAEIELGDEHESFERPAWLGAEVTGDPRYYNSSLIQRPYSSW